VIGVTKGYALANIDSIDILVKGVGGHGAYPYTTKDPIVLASRIVMALQTLVSRENNPLDPAVVTVGSFHAGTKRNIISDEAKLQLTVRSYSPATRKLLLDGIKRIARGEAIAQTLRNEGLKIARRSRGEALSGDTDIYLADTLGDLGLLFRVAGIAFIGGSLVAKGGHNPFEAARLGCAVLHGDDMSNCAGMAAALDRAGAALTVFDAESLGETVARLLGNPGERRARAKAATQVAAAGSGILDKVFLRLAPFLDGLAPAAQHAGPPGVPQVRHGRLQIAAEDAHP